MTADLEKEQIGLKAAAQALNQKSNVLLAACEMLVEYRQLTSRLLGHCEVLKAKIDETAKPNGEPIPGQAQAASQPHRG